MPRKETKEETAKRIENQKRADAVWEKIAKKIDEKDSKKSSKRFKEMEKKSTNADKKAKAVRAYAVDSGIRSEVYDNDFHDTPAKVSVFNKSRMSQKDVDRLSDKGVEIYSNAIRDEVGRVRIGKRGVKSLAAAGDAISMLKKKKKKSKIQEGKNSRVKKEK